MLFTGKVYDFMKKLVQIIIPATSSAYFGLAGIWDLPYAEQVVGTLAVLATFIGILIGISSKQYAASGAAYDGNLVVSHEEDGAKLVYGLELTTPPEELQNKESITFKLVPPTS